MDEPGIIDNKEKKVHFIKELNEIQAQSRESLSRQEIEKSHQRVEVSEFTPLLHNMEKTVSGKELTYEQKEINDYFRGDHFRDDRFREDKPVPFENTIEAERKEQLIKKNSSLTCGFEENLDGHIKGNEPMSASQKEAFDELREERTKVPKINEDTVMQKVISPEVFEKYTRDESPITNVSGCATRFEDVADCTNNLKQSYETLRLDYEGNPYKAEIESGGEMYVMRFTSKHPLRIDEYPKSDESNPPCTGTGFTGSEHHLVPEYRYEEKSQITDGAIFLVKDNGEEYLAAYWKRDHFKPV